MGQNKLVGEVASINSHGKDIFYMVTKKVYYGKPTYKTLESCLMELYFELKLRNIKKISMPKIGCGLDKLNWDSVEKIIKKIFVDVDVDITIYVL